MNKKTIRVSLLLGVAALGVVTAAGFMTNSFRMFKGSNAATVQESRRLYVCLEGDWDVYGDPATPRMFIHYWGGEGVVGTTWGSCPEMTKVVSDYYDGLFYYDVPMDITAFVVKNVMGTVPKTSNQSDDILISDLFVENDYKVAVVQPWVSDFAQRMVEKADNAPMNSLQAAAVLNNIDSCSSSYAGGYNSWPQLDDLFITPSTLEGSTVVIDNFGDDTTIAAKIAYLEYRYNLDQAGV